MCALGVTSLMTLLSHSSTGRCTGLIRFVDIIQPLYVLSCARLIDVVSGVFDWSHMHLALQLSTSPIAKRKEQCMNIDPIGENDMGSPCCGVE